MVRFHLFKLSKVIFLALGFGLAATVLVADAVGDFLTDAADDLRTVLVPRFPEDDCFVLAMGLLYHKAYRKAYWLTVKK